MTTNHSRSWRQITAIALMGTTVVCGLALGSATVANADAKSQQAQSDAFDKCVNDGGTWKSCCVAVGGTYWTATGSRTGLPIEGCTFNDGRTAPARTRTASIPGLTSAATSLN
jgi:hypothetical protein